MISSSTLAAFALALPLVAACDPDDKASTGAGLIEDRIVAAYCHVLDKCYGEFSTAESSILLLLRDAPDAVCVPALKRILFAESPRDQRILAGELSVNEARLSACITALERECTLERSALCQEAVEGKVALGDACTSSDDCAGDAYCDADNPSCGGHCIARGGAGSACNGSDECTALGTTPLACSYESDKCVPLVTTSNATANAACGEVHTADAVTFTRCGASLACDQETCQPIIAKGAACADDNSPCKYGTVCTPDASSEGGTCEDHPFVDTVGASCSEDFDGATPAFCNPVKNLGCVAGKCEQGGDGSLGSKCFALDLAGRCNAGLFCDRAANTCKQKLVPGTSCTSDSDCLSDWCDDNAATPVCAAYPVCQ